jgi:PAS domain S-box-containing protein
MKRVQPHPLSLEKGTQCTVFHQGDIPSSLKIFLSTFLFPDLALAQELPNSDVIPECGPFFYLILGITALQSCCLVCLFWDRLHTRKRERIRADLDRRFRNFFHNSPVAIATLDPKTMRVVHANTRFLDMHGYSEEEMTRLRLDEFTHPDDMPPELELIRSLTAGETNRYVIEKRQIRKDGGTRWVRVTGCPIETDGEEPVLFAGVIEDITDKKEVEEALRKSEQQIRSLIATIPGGVFRCDVDDSLRVIFASEGAFQNTGYTASEFVNGKKTYMDIVHPDDLPRCLRTIKEAIKAHDIYEITYRLYHADGGIRWIHERGRATYDEQGRPEFLDGVAIDITYRHATEEALFESEKRFRTLAENVPDVIARMDNSMRYVYLNRAFERVTGKKIEDYLYKTIAEADIPKHLANTWEQKRREVFKTGQPQTTEFDFHTFKGLRTFHSVMVPEFSTDGQVQTILIVSRDITDILRMKQELNQRTQELDSFFNSALDLLCIADANGNIQRFNPAWETTLGYPLSDLLGRRFLDLVHPEDLGATLEALNQIINQKPVNSFINRYRRIDGSYRWLEWRSQPVGEIMIGSARDITDRINSEAERFELERRIQQSQRMESLGVLAGGIAHDFNNLLTVILGNLDLVKESLGPASHVEAELDESLLAATRAAELTRQMLAYAGKGRFAIIDISINDLVSDSSQMLSMTLPKAVDIQYKLDEQRPQIQADPVQLQQVVTNILMNAIEAIGGNPGTITIRTGSVEVDEEYLKRDHLEEEIGMGRYAIIEVSDTGCGMSPETQSKIFEPFFSTKFTGRGLGMSVVLGIVRAHKGTLSIESCENTGTTIRVLLPLKEDPPGVAC